MVEPPHATRPRLAVLERQAVGADGLAEAVEPARLAGQVGTQALAGRDAIPAAGHHGALLLDAERRHHDVARLVAPGKARAVRLLRRGHQQVEEIGAAGGGVFELVVGDELRQRRVGLVAADAVDRVGVIARDRQQPLDAGVARLLVVVFGVLGEIGDQALLGLGRLDGGEARDLLAGAVAALRRRQHEGVGADAEIGVPGLRQRRAAIHRQRAGMDVEGFARQRALDHRAALARVDPEPAAGRRRALVLDRDRRLDHIAHAAANLQIGARRLREARSKPPAEIRAMLIRCIMRIARDIYHGSR